MARDALSVEQAIQQIIEEGVHMEDRTGVCISEYTLWRLAESCCWWKHALCLNKVGTRSMFGHQMRFNLSSSLNLVESTQDRLCNLFG